MEIHITSRAENETAFLTIDGQVGEPLQRDDMIACRRSENCVHLIRPPRMMFFDVLREKLSWGER
jgi:NAD+ kinase